MTAAKERTENVFPLAAFSSSLPETRVWGSDFENQPFIGASSWISSTTRWGCRYQCDGIASDEIVQRYYASSYGRFNSPDPYKSGSGSGTTSDPLSWNKYAYVEGDPINFNDPSGMARCHVVGTYTTRPNPDDALTEVTTAQIQCTSQYGYITETLNVAFDGNYSQAEKNAEASVGGDLDQTELDRLLYGGYVAAQQMLENNPDCQGIFGNATSRANGWDPATILGDLFITKGIMGVCRTDWRR